MYSSTYIHVHSDVGVVEKGPGACELASGVEKATVGSNGDGQHSRLGLAFACSSSSVCNPFLERLAQRGAARTGLLDRPCMGRGLLGV
jgi:hypothetical protein